MSTRSGRNVTKVDRFDPTVNKNDVSDEEEEEEEEEEEPKAAKKSKKAPVKKVTKRKVAKDSGAPKEKRPLTAYFLFLADERPVLVKEQPDLGAKEVVTTLATRWKALSEDKKKKYTTAAAKAKAEYDAKKGPSETTKKSKK